MATQYASSLPYITRGTTPTLTFTTPYDADMVKDGYITFTLRGAIIIDVEVTDESVTISDQMIAIHLTQEQTLLFDADDTNLVQVRLLLESGNVVASNTVALPISDVLKEDVIPNG